MKHVLFNCAIGVLFGVCFGLCLPGVTGKPLVPKGQYMLHRWHGTNFSPNLDASIHEFMPFDDSKFEAGDTAIEVDESGRWHVIQSV